MFQRGKYVIEMMVNGEWKLWGKAETEEEAQLMYNTARCYAECRIRVEDTTEETTTEETTEETETTKPKNFTWNKDYMATPGGPYNVKSYWSTESNFCGDLYEPCEEFKTYLACIYDENKEDYIAKKEFDTEEEAKTWIENQIK